MTHVSTGLSDERDPVLGYVRCAYNKNKITPAFVTVLPENRVRRLSTSRPQSRVGD